MQKTLSQRTPQHPQHYILAPTLHESAPCAFRALLRKEPATMSDKTPFGLTPSSGNKAVIEYLEATKELATTSPSVAREMLRILENEGDASATVEPDAADSIDNQVTATAPVSPEIEVAVRPARSRRRKKSRSGAKATRSRGSSKQNSLLEHHQTQCGICGSEHQEEIEEAFINWESVDTIARGFSIPRRTVYRHAHATGLFAKRDRNIRRALGLIIHRADKVRDVSADSVIRAAKTLAHINEHGEWTTPPTHVIVSSGTARPSNTSSHDQVDTRCHLHPRLTP